MENYAVFQMPQTINYGRHAFKKLGEEAATRGKKALVVSDKVMDSLGYVKKGLDYLHEAGVEGAVYLGVESEPTDVYVDEAMKLFEQESCDLVISIGGGSCLDTAKTIAVLQTNGGYIGDYMGNQKIATKAAIPHIAVPTTAGTGSEATDVTVITNTSNDVKMMIKQPAFLPEVAIVDPLLTISSPKHVTAATGVDALSHAVEAYISKKAQPMTDMMALSAMELIVKNLQTAYQDGDDVDAREGMSLAALQAGVAFSNASVCLVHGMSRPIGAMFHVPHGYSNAMLLPAVLEYSKDYALERLADLGRFFSAEAENYSHKEAADFAVQSVKKLCLDLNIPNLQGWGIDKQEFDIAIPKMAKDALASGSPGNNPRVPTQAEVEELYRICYSYDFTTDVSTKESKVR
ncbi:iron-containing alcohol dehydrogenase [Aquibacillus sediminis]|uniref:iron-containing alcohol dehydrogenase n=1 Tax=Aquibacillus sediminis TaxID=2574734 RepID=UPI001109045F|nr:iron-containing alcohol dehydrogenase [Aquibacillus sediminis]